VDLLDHLGEKAGDQKAARGAGVFGAERGNAPAVLLAGMPTSVRGFSAFGFQAEVRGRSSARSHPKTFRCA